MGLENVNFKCKYNSPHHSRHSRREEHSIHSHIVSAPQSKFSWRVHLPRLSRVMTKFIISQDLSGESFSYKCRSNESISRLKCFRKINYKIVNPLMNIQLCTAYLMRNTLRSWKLSENIQIDKQEMNKLVRLSKKVR